MVAGTTLTAPMAGQGLTGRTRRRFGQMCSIFLGYHTGQELYKKQACKAILMRWCWAAFFK